MSDFNLNDNQEDIIEDVTQSAEQVTPESQFEQQSYNQQIYNQANNTQNQKKQGNGFAIASLVLGIIAFVFFCTCCNVFFAIASVIFGVIALCGYQGDGNKGMAIAGIVLSVLSVFMLIASSLAITRSVYAFQQMILNQVESAPEGQTEEAIEEEISKQLDQFMEQLYGQGRYQSSPKDSKGSL